MYTYDDLFKLFWDKDTYAFDRDVHDRFPYRIRQEEDKVVLIHNVVGVAEEDLEVKIKTKKGKDRLTMLGATKDEEFGEYSVNSSFEIQSSNFEKIQYKVKNGLLCIYLFKKKPNQSLAIEKM